MDQNIIRVRLKSSWCALLYCISHVCTSSLRAEVWTVRVVGGWVGGVFKYGASASIYSAVINALQRGKCIPGVLFGGLNPCLGSCNWLYCWGSWTTCQFRYLKLLTLSSSQTVLDEVSFPIHHLHPSFCSCWGRGCCLATSSTRAGKRSNQQTNGQPPHLVMETPLKTPCRNYSHCHM